MNDLNIHIACKFAAIVFFFSALAASVCSGEIPERDVRILQSDPSGIVVEFIPSYGVPSSMSLNGQVFSRYTFEGGFLPDPMVTGSPELLARSFLLRFRGQNNNRVEILKVDYEDIPNVLLAPVPSYREGEISPTATYSADPKTYGGTEFVPSEIASLARIGETRGSFLGNLVVRPLQYNPSSRTLRKHTRIVVRVDFGEAESPIKQAGGVRGIALNDDAFDVRQSHSVRQTTVLRRSVLSSGVWYRCAITEDGMYKLTGQTLLDAGIPSSADPRSISIFGNGGYETPMAVNAPYVDDLVQNAVYVYDGGIAGQLDASDYVIFFGKATRGWSYNPINKTFSHYINHFTETNTYWLTFGGSNKLMAEVPSLNQPTPFQPSTVMGKLFRKDDKVNLLSSGLEWMGQPINPGDQITYVHSLPGIDYSRPIRYIFDVASRSSATATMTITEHGSSLVGTVLPATLFGDYPYQISERTLTLVQTPTFSDGQSQLRFAYVNPNPASNGYVRWYELFYPRLLKAQNDLFNFHAADTNAVTEYSIVGFSAGQTMVFDVTKYDSALLISNPHISADTCRFQVSLNAGSARELYAVGQNGFKSPGSLTRVANQNLHGDAIEVPYVIITHSEFMSAAQRLKAYREQQGPNYLKTTVVDVDQIYNEFGGGLLSPPAIRNYLRYLYMNWSSPPKYVLFIGDGDFDYKNIIVSNPNWIPPWESPESFEPLSSYASEGAYVSFFNADRVEMGLGRLTVRSLQEANTVIDKIIEYETKSVNDPWKIRTTFVADDGLQAPGANDGFRHTDDQEDAARLVPSLFEKKKIYLYDYPTVYSAGGRRKPAVNQAIRDQINQGTLMLNFAGHGNPRVWTHEAVFVRETDIPLLHNKGKYFFLAAATCNYSHFDMLNDQSSGELLVSMPDAGAIATFSANRPVFANENALLNQALCRNLFISDSTSRVLPKRLGDVIFRTMQQGTGRPDNDKKYLLLGDPALRIAFPSLTASIDSINHFPNTLVTQLKALERASVSVAIKDTASHQPTNLSGKAQLVVFDANRTVKLDASHEDPRPFPTTTTYVGSGSTLFRGDQTVSQGSMLANFIVPKDISYSNDSGRIVVYFWNDSTDGAGYTTNIRISGADSTAPPDANGPEIHLYVDGKGFRPGDIVTGSPLLIADLFDSSGINTSGSGVGHRIEAWLDNSSQSIGLSDFYKSKPDSFQAGTVEYSLGSLAEGTHKVRLRAWDTYNNSSNAQTVFDVVSGVGLKLTNIFNYPNPFSSATVFTFEHNQVLSVDAEVKIYTVAGRLIQSLKMPNVSTQFVRISWDGRDKDGDGLANGVYLYKVVAKTLDGRFASEAYGKLGIIR